MKRTVFAALLLVSITATPSLAQLNCDNSGRCVQNGSASASSFKKTSTRIRVVSENVRFIPNPPGTWRRVASCAHRLAAYWGLGKGLDAVATWVKVFPRASGPAVGLAAIRRDRHHVLGIVGGSPGAWQVVDFNSGGHRNREYTASGFPGYFFVDPRQRSSRLASNPVR